MGILGNSAGGGTSFNPAAPGPIGGSTPAAITGTTITATTKFLAADGTISAPAYSFSSDTSIGLFVSGGKLTAADDFGGTVTFGTAGAGGLGANLYNIGSGSGGQWVSSYLSLRNDSQLNWSSTSNATQTRDIGLQRVGPGILGQYASTTAQEYQLYGTHTDASNYERLALRTAAGSYTITPEAAGTGTLRGMILGAASTSIGFFGVTPAARAAAYTPTNVTTDRSFDADATSTAELADVLGTLIADLQAYGLLQ